MKYVITKSQRNSIVEKLIRLTIPVIDIEFKDMKTISVKDGKTKRVIITWIYITVDPNEVPSRDSQYLNVEKKINDQLMKHLNINTFQLRAPYNIRIIPMDTNKVKN